MLLKAATVAEQVGDVRMRSYAEGYLGHLYETEYRYDEALQLTRRAVFSAQSANAPESLFRWQWQLGRLLAATSKLDEAIASYGNATATLRPIRMEVAAAWGKDSFTGDDSVRGMFFEFADLLLQRASLTADQQVAERYLRSARDAIETYKAAELRDYFRDDCVDTLQARITKLDHAGRRNCRGVSHRLRGSIGTAGQPPQWTQTAVDPRLINHAHTGGACFSQNGRKANDAPVSPSRPTTLRLVDPPARTGFSLFRNHIRWSLSPMARCARCRWLRSMTAGSFSSKNLRWPPRPA